MQRRVDLYLPKAFEALRNVEIDEKRFINSEGIISKEYKGYISSLGANIIQAGIKAALTFYEANDSGAKSDRRLVNAAIKYIITGVTNPSYNDCHLTGLLNGSASEDEIQKKTNEILDAATALKLALRTFKLE